MRHFAYIRIYFLKNLNDYQTRDKEQHLKMPLKLMKFILLNTA